MKAKLILFVILGAALSLLSCNNSSNDDPCKERDCVHGVCFEGTCNCEAGWVKDANGNCTLLICDTLDCVHGTCNTGICTCDPGYEKDANGRCTVVNILNFVPGSYQVDEDCSSGSYLAIITHGSSANEFEIHNFWGLFTNTVKVTVEGSSLTIARQEPDQDHFFVEGTGTFVKNASGPDTIVMSYVITDETNPNAIISVACANTVYIKL